MDNNEFARQAREILGFPGDVVSNTDGVDTNTLALERLQECVNLATTGDTLPATGTLVDPTKFDE